ncbi:septum formation family protein [Actinoplanes sp. NPDC051411]|uniref:septum formation family protein n=1 Tax=Actinoplanes sp. NPDC051411 TaxID=3155522 RepID=UPI00341E77EC
MRRWAATLTCTFLLFTASACGGAPKGIDGDLTDDWAPPAPAAQFRPAAGTCHDDLSPEGSLDDYAPIPCTAAHVAESAAVVDLPGAEGPKDRARSAGDAFNTCSRQADAFLGGDWRTGWLLLQPVLPSPAAWNGGARWVRCDLAEVSPLDGRVINRKTSLKAGLKAGGGLRMTCANPTIKGEQVTEMHPVTCSKSHTSEFAGLFTTTAKTSGAVSENQVAKGCDAAIARFTRIPDDGSITARVGWLGFPPDDSSWAAGDHSIRCFLWLNGEKMTGSYRNAGPAKLKIHYTS